MCKFELLGVKFDTCFTQSNADHIIISLHVPGKLLKTQKLFHFRSAALVCKSCPCPDYKECGVRLMCKFQVSSLVANHSVLQTKMTFLMSVDEFLSQIYSDGQTAFITNPVSARARLLFILFCGYFALCPSQHLLGHGVMQD